MKWGRGALFGAAAWLAAMAASGPCASRASDIDAGPVFRALQAHRVVSAPWPDPPSRQAALSAIKGVLSDPALVSVRETLQAGRFDAAAQQLQALAPLDQPHAFERLRQAGALAFFVNPQRAIDAYEAAAANRPGDRWVRVWLAQLYGAAGKPSLALACARAALKSTGDTATVAAALDELGDALASRGWLAEARDAYKRELALRRALLARSPDDMDRR